MRRRRLYAKGFTLVEVLVVILIISLLVALMIPVIRGVMRRAEDFRYAQELSNLEMAIYAYKEKYKDFPPDFTDAPDGLPRQYFLQKTVAGRHILMAFPRISDDELERITGQKSDNTPSLKYKKLFQVDAASALVFWLGGLSKDPTHPFTGQGGPLTVDERSTPQVVSWRPLSDRTEPLFDFDESRLSKKSVGDYVVWVAYTPPNNPTPYVYFDSRTYEFVDSGGNPQYASFSWPAPGGGGITMALPYKSIPKSFNPTANPPTANPNDWHWANRDTFQLICAGHDGEFGPLTPPPNNTIVLTQFPSLIALSSSPLPSNYDHLQGQRDNITNFSEGQTLENAKP
jgi:prepilin-type N-terminal cleavage/methylation domain-containing protein